MQQINYLTELLGFQGFYDKGNRKKKEFRMCDEVVLDLERDGGYICSGCNQEVYSKHSSYYEQSE